MIPKQYLKSFIRLEQLMILGNYLRLMANYLLLRGGKIGENRRLGGESEPGNLNGSCVRDAVAGALEFD